jgi:hypothetical protein
LGQLTFATATKITLNNIFTSEFRNYRIVLSGTASGTNPIYYRFTVAGSETATNYSYTLVACGPTDAAPTKQLGGTSVSAGVTGYFVTASNSYAFDILDPQVADYTKVISRGLYSTAVSDDSSGVLAANTQFDGMSIFPGAGTFTGVLSVYGYNK